MIVTITGENDLLRKQEVSKLVVKFSADYGDVAIERLDGEEATSERMQESVQSMPFLSPRKMVVLREPGKQKTFVESIDSVLANVADTTDLVLYEPKLDRRSIYYKTLKKVTDFREFNDLDEANLYKWATDYVSANSGRLTISDAKILIDRVGTNQQSILHELDKLLLYDGSITGKTIQLLTEPLPQSNIFDLLSAAFSSDGKRTFKLYREQRALKIEPQAIIAMLAWQLHVIALIKTSQSRSVEQIAKESKTSPFVIRKSQTLASRLSLESIKQLVSELLKLDSQLKSTNIDADEALQLYLIKLINS